MLVKSNILKKPHANHNLFFCCNLFPFKVGILVPVRTSSAKNVPHVLYENEKDQRY